MENIALVSRSSVTGNVSAVSPSDFTRVTRRIVRDHSVTEQEAAQMLQGALDFLTMCSQHHGQEFTPSREVDDAWHTLLLYTKIYERFCRALGAKLHHEPNDGPVQHVGGYARTIKFMDEHRIVRDPALWEPAGMAGDSVADPSTCCSEISLDLRHAPN